MTTTTYTVYTGRKAANGRQRQRPQADSTRKKVIRLPISEAKKRANKKWDKENMRSFSVQLRKEVFEEAEEERKKRGFSRADVIKDWLRMIKESHK